MFKITFFLESEPIFDLKKTFETKTEANNWLKENSENIGKYLEDNPIAYTDEKTEYRVNAKVQNYAKD